MAKTKFTVGMPHSVAYPLYLQKNIHTSTEDSGTLRTQIKDTTLPSNNFNDTP